MVDLWSSQVSFSRQIRQALGMFGQDEIEDLKAHFPERERARDDLHALLDIGPAGRDDAPASPDLDDAEPAAAEGDEAGMVAKRRDIDAVVPGGVEDGLPAFDVEGQVIDGDLHGEIRSRLVPVNRETARTFTGQTS